MKARLNNIIARQFRKPTGIFGKFISKKMQKGNSVVYDWMISLMEFEKAKNVLEIGYGTGKVLFDLATTHKEINFFGIDFSKVMYEKAIKNNDIFIKDTRMFLEYGELLSYQSPTKIDVIYCINVIYFWDDLKAYLLKIRDLLNSGGVVYIYMTDPNFLKSIFGQTSVFNKYSVEEVIRKINECGFSNNTFVTGKIGHRVGYSIKAIK